MARPGRRKILFVAIVVLALVVFAEGLARVGFLVIHHRPYRPADLRQFGTASLSFGAESPIIPEHLSTLVLHPYLGFVVDAEDPASRIGLGFGFGASPLESLENEGALRVLVLGGSVGLQLMTADSATGSQFLYDALVAVLGEAGIQRDVWLYNAALPGFKQPQQVMSYAYLLSQGAEFDVVVNVDGVNEMTLALVDQKPVGLHPAYPRAWEVMVRRQWTPGQLRQAGEIFALRGRQMSAVEWAEKSPWARSAGVGLWLARRIAADEVRARELIGELERQWHAGLSFEEGGVPFDYGNAEATCDYLSKLWSRSSQALDRMAEGSGARYLHVFQPNQYLEGSKPLTQKERAEFYRPDTAFGPAYRATYPCFRREMDALSANGEWLLDASMLFERETETVYSDWCCHFNEYGLRRLAAAIAGEIVAKSKRIGDS
jgi:hypothetical protein